MVPCLVTSWKMIHPSLWPVTHVQHDDMCCNVQLEDNLKSLQLLPKLTPEVMDKIDAILKTKPEPAPTYGR